MARKRVVTENQELPVPLTLRALRKRQGLRQYHVAQALGIHRDGVSKQENGHTKMAVQYLPVLARLYAVPVEVVIQACLSRNGEEHEIPMPSWETKVRKVLRDLARLTREKDNHE